MENKLKNEVPVRKNTDAIDDQELNYWSNKFGIGRDELIEVVKRGGTFAKAVENFVKKTELAL